ncbi:MAG: hypothetical protein AABY22_24865, partial [Nanoarchaeota archaeon]
FLKCSFDGNKIVFDTKKQYEASKTPKEWLLKGMGQFTDEKGIYHLKNKEYDIAWSPCYDEFTTHIWCQKSNLKLAKEKCIKELKKQKLRIKKICSEKEKQFINYKKWVENFCLNYT